ncbi:YcaO-like family protein [Alicyclobacillus sp. SO9]|uniref:YcaO-like family protein n=1 Tax=Alicyclobacillus sp. SO9 TaxID=2665646 RepID=UPI0018E71067|nr:YcaO-like family protein [Alicyclobacillus sp. SO9]QQE80165.1 YcaO-like family protein [Alicyclobacillus sp. SO9]
MTMMITNRINDLIDSKYGLIQRIMKVPEYPGRTMPQVKVYVTTGGLNKVRGFSASGAGVTDESAIVSAVGEYVERYCALAVEQGNTANISEIKHQNIEIIDLSLLQNMKNKEQDKLRWTIGQDLLSRTSVAIPSQMVYLSFAQKLGERQHWVTTATGAAAGQTWSDAVYRGLAECFERDAIQVMWRNQIKIPHIDFLGNHEIRGFYDKFIACSSVKFHLYKLITDYDVPAVFGLAEIDDGGVVAAASVRGTWVDACKKTLIELSQSLVGYSSLIFSKEVQHYREDFSDVATYDDHTLLYFNPHMRKYLEFLLESKETIQLPSDDVVFDDVNTYIQQFLKQLDAVGVKAIAVDITTQDIKEFGWFVAKVIIPGFADLEPGTELLYDYERLRQVPLKLLESGRRKEGHIGGSPIAPHPFP